MSVNSWIDGKVLEILQAFGVDLPGGNGDTLRSIARGWDSMGTELTGAVRVLDRAVAGVDKQGWHGAAHDAFEKHWQDQKKTLTDAAKNFHRVADGLRNFADEIDKINEEIIDICVQIAEMEVLGAALSAFTGFLSDLVANTAVAAKVAKIVDLVKLFTSAAEKVAALLERFAGLSAETAATLEKMLSTVARLSARFATKTGEGFATNFVADSASSMLNQAVTGQRVTVGDDLVGGSRAALGTALFAGGSATLADAAGATGVAGRMLRGDGLLGTTVNGAAGNVAGGLTADVWSGKDGSTSAWDAGTNALTGGLGNAQNHGVHHALEQHGSLGGENLSDRGKLADSTFRNVVDTGLNTGVYGAGSGIESDAQSLVEDEKKMAKGE
ncbi:MULTISPECIES: WXG100 family type VII secretion target [unclassified Streptomyces]|uniref:WXG100-like domain-containing protein n=1 Tax=unclassified Streptomyces TaxID=2593676 RepID=UPI000889954A|nr:MULTISPECIES: WXG100 family type VII secretion target [unclassified Streptomyces]PBC83908.1 type VII secretion system (Wss) protein ESAT-6 [Streptomyces sp. 2321.6]SDR37289.1 Proteins of 100 residues with WXG [Streptomyces sp. KS_16]SED13131.1 Proteins of 100 residues with WXG [Streptomyces sp. 2133.1]SNC69986.1 Proteins of 100 residues with WXG [Streptomyces sp. 2114.4]